MCSIMFFFLNFLVNIYTRPNYLEHVAIRIQYIQIDVSFVKALCFQAKLIECYHCIVANLESVDICGSEWTTPVFVILVVNRHYAEVTFLNYAIGSVL